MLNLRIREYSPTGERGRVLPAQEIDYVHQLSGTPTLSFSLSEANAGKLEAPYVVRVEYSVNGSRFKPVPEQDYFLMEEDSNDDTDPTKVVSYSGIGYVSWLLGKTYLHWSGSAKNGERLWSESGHPASAGTILGGMLTESKNRGWGKQLTYDFTWNKDSNGAAWTANEKVLQNWRLLTPLTSVLEELVNSGLCEWTSEGLKIRLFRPETRGSDKTEVVLGGSAFEHIPVKSDASEIFTNLTVVPEKAYYWLYLTNPGADSRFGRLEATMTQSGIESHAEATKLAQTTLKQGRTLNREEAYEWTPSQGSTLVPWDDIKVGDYVTALARGGRVQRRVIGLVIRESGGKTTVRAVVGERLKTASTKLRDRVSATTSGGHVGGSGNAFPSTPGFLNIPPAAPVGVVATTEAGEWLEDGTQRSPVTVQWAPVTEAVDGSEATVTQYEVWSRTGEGTRTLDTATHEPKAVIDAWAPGILRLVSVRAFSSNGEWSEFSNEVAVTPSHATAGTPKAPTGVEVVSNSGEWTVAGAMSEITLRWVPVTESVADEPITITNYELFVNDVPTALLPPTVASATHSLPVGLTATYRVRARSDKGLWSDLSPELSVTGAKPAVVVRNPTTPVLTTGAGNAFARWDGVYVSGGTAGAHRVDVEARIGTGAWAVQGTLVGAGQQIITLGGIGDVVAVRLRAYDQLGRLTGTSVEATVTVVGIEIPDLDQSVSDMLAGMETDISDALGAANAAQGTANTAATAADQALADALAAANAASAAQGTANNAQTTANSKGKTIIQNAAPAAADQLAQNLWIDTTGGANTPKRWSGSAWVAVTDKAATDAAASAVTAKNAADTAQARADSAFTTATNAATAAGQAQTTANAKNRVWYTNTMPPGTAHKVDDVWFDGANGNRINTWSGSAWVVRQMGTNAIANLAITNALIANGTIQNAKIADLDAAKITTGELAAARIGANSITANKIAVGDFTNLVYSPHLDTGNGVVGMTGATVYTGPEVSPTGSRLLLAATRDHAAQLGFMTSAQQGEEFYVEVLAKRIAGSKPLNVKIGQWGRDGNTNPGAPYWGTVNVVPQRLVEDMGDGWGRYAAVWKFAPTAVTAAKVGLYLQLDQGLTGGDPNGTHQWVFTDPVLRRRSTGELIVDGAIQARHVTMDEGFANKFWANEANVGKIRVDYVEPNFGDNLNLWANEAVEIIVGRQDDQETMISDAQDTANNAESEAEEAQRLAREAEEAARIADGKALVAQEWAQEAGDRLTAQQAVFRVTEYGAEIASRDNSNLVQITPTGVTIVQGGTAASTWDAGRLIVSEAIVTKAQIANHGVEKSGAGRTIFRPL